MTWDNDEKREGVFVFRDDRKRARARVAQDGKTWHWATYGDSGWGIDSGAATSFAEACAEAEKSLAGPEGR